MSEPTPEKIKDLEIHSELGLNKFEYDLLCERLGRLPNYVELGMFSAMWSEHCCYKNSINLLKRFPTKGENVLQGPGEGAGVIDIGEGYGIAFKIESHNHPSAVEPFQGAATGVGGILRDIFSMGARPIALMNSLRFGYPDTPRTKYLIDGVAKGISHYGNAIGVPTVGGEFFVDESFTQNVLVNVMGVGLVKKDEILTSATGKPGLPVYYVGAMTGRDGIHGASFASEELGEQSEKRKPCVQVGDPFMGKLLMEACLELFRTGSVLAVQDMGAAGVTCASSEMAHKGGCGIDIDVANIPVRVENITAFEIMLSESQERMLFVLDPEKVPLAQAVCEKWNVPIAHIGYLNDTGNFTVRENGVVKADVPLHVMCEDTPRYERNCRPYKIELKPIPELMHEEFTKTFQELLRHPNITSKKAIYSQFDSMVGVRTVFNPGGEAGVLKLEDSNLSVAITVDGDSAKIFLNPLAGGKLSVYQSYANLISVGATPLGITNGLNFGSPEKGEVYYQMKECVEGISQACESMNIPVTGGNVSLYNESGGTPVMPTAVIGMMGKIEKRKKYISHKFRQAGDRIYLIGSTDFQIPGSTYQKHVSGSYSGDIEVPNEDWVKNLFQGMKEMIDLNIFNSVKDISDGGMAVAIAECTNRELGALINVLKGSLEGVFFGESNPAFIVSLPMEHESEFERHCIAKRLPFNKVGMVIEENLIINHGGKYCMDLELEELWDSYEESLGKKLNS